MSRKELQSTFLTASSAFFSAISANQPLLNKSWIHPSDGIIIPFAQHEKVGNLATRWSENFVIWRGKLTNFSGKILIFLAPVPEK